MNRRVLAFTFTAAACAALAPASTVAREFIEEIVVTAEKRESTVQDTAVAVSAFTQADLDTALTQRFDDLQRMVPNLQMGSTGDLSKLSIRGVGNELVQASGDPGVALHLAGMYQPRPNQLFHTFYDLERIEVLRGPQSTLYGRNANGGTINLVPARPDPGGPGFAGDVEFAEFDKLRLRGTVNLPLAGERLAARVAFVHQDEDGKVRSSAPGIDDVNEDDVSGVRPSVLWTPTDRLGVYLLAEFVRMDGTGPVQRALRDPNFSQLVGGTYGSNPFTCAFFGIGAFTLSGTCAPATPQVGDLYETALDVAPDRNVDYDTYVLEIDWSLNGMTLTSVTGFQETENRSTRDIDASDADILALSLDSESRTRSQELRLQSDSDDPLQWMVGGYWFDDVSKSPDTVFAFGADSSFGALIPLFGPIVITSGPGTQSSAESWAAFGRVEYRVDERWAVKAGLRRTDEEKKGYRAPLLFLGFPTGPAVFADDDFQNVSGDLSAEYTPDDDTLWYLKFARGFKSGGQNLGSVANPLFDEEIVSSIELGWKKTFLDGRAQANTAFFYYGYEDYQVQVFDATLPPVGGNTNFNYDATVWGIEFESRWVPVENLEFGFNAAYLNTELDEGINEDQRDAILTFDAAFTPGQVILLPPPRQSLGGNRLPRSPELGLSGSVSYDIQLGEAGVLTPGARLYWQDKVHYDVFNSSLNTQDSHTLVDAYLNWNSAGGRYYAQLFVRNATDEEYATDILSTSLQNGGHETASVGIPRIFGIRVGARMN